MRFDYYFEMTNVEVDYDCRMIPYVMIRIREVNNATINAFDCWVHVNNPVCGLRCLRN